MDRGLLVCFVITDILILCTIGRGARQTKTPWLLAALQNVVLNQPLTLESISSSMATNRGDVGTQFGVQPPADRPAQLLINLRVLPDEEFWLELTDESTAFELCDKIATLREASSRRFPGNSSPRSDIIDTLAVRLKEKRSKFQPSYRRTMVERRSRNSERTSRAGASVHRVTGDTRGTGDSDCSSQSSGRNTDRGFYPASVLQTSAAAPAAVRSSRMFSIRGSTRSSAGSTNR